METNRLALEVGIGAGYGLSFGCLGIKGQSLCWWATSGKQRLLAGAVSTQNLAVTLLWGCFVSRHVLPHSLYLWEELGLAAPRAFSGSVGPEGGAGVGSGNLWPRLWKQGRQVA